MEVLKSNAHLLCNYEVMKLLQEMRDQQDKKTRKQKSNLANITFDTLRYLHKMPCTSQTPEIVHNFLLATHNLPITKFEKLQILNLRPTSNVELQLILEEVEERFTEPEMKTMLAQIAQLLPPPTPAPEGRQDAQAGRDAS